jgi:hypothetical protein
MLSARQQVVVQEEAGRLGGLTPFDPAIGGPRSLGPQSYLVTSHSGQREVTVAYQIGAVHPVARPEGQCGQTLAAW